MTDATEAAATQPFFFVQPSALWSGVHSIRDFLPQPPTRGAAAAPYVNSATRFLLVVALVLAIVLRSLWPIAIGAGVLLLAMLLAAGYAAIRRATAPRPLQSAFVDMAGDVLEERVADEALVERQLQADTLVDGDPAAACDVAARDEFARLMNERYAETAVRAREQTALAQPMYEALNALEPYDPAATIPNPSRHNNWYEVDARYRPASPWTFAHKRVQAVGYADDVPADQVGPTKVPVESHTAADLPAPSESAGRATNILGLNPDQARTEHMPHMYREGSSLNAAGCVDDIYAQRRAAARAQPATTPANDAVTTPMQDPTERMIESMYKDVDETFWQTMIADRAPPPFINPNDSQARRREEAAALERQSWRAFSMHQGP